VPLGQLVSLPLPCIATFLPEGDLIATTVGRLEGEDVTTTSRVYRLILLQRVDERYVYFTEACHMTTVSLHRDEFRRRFAGTVILFPSTMTEKHLTRLHDVSMDDDDHAALPPASASTTGWFKALWRKAGTALDH